MAKYKNYCVCGSDHIEWINKTTYRCLVCGKVNSTMTMDEINKMMEELQCNIKR